MYENLVKQEASKNLISDIKNSILPRALLFYGDNCSGKLTAALETARILSCQNSKKGEWRCECNFCVQSKSLINSNILLLGHRDCSLEIISSKKTFLNAVSTNASFLTATRYLFLRSIRKLTLRFNPLLWKGDSNFNKIGGIIDDINENLEILDFPHTLPPLNELEKICNSLEKSTNELENKYLYDSIPISQIRNMEEWAQIKSDFGKKTIIIENAENMLAGVRNALLKILEEPPLDCQFILLTSNRNAIMQTILSRVRTYNFLPRSIQAQQEVIQRVFHNEFFNGTINEYLLTFLPISPAQIKKQATIFFEEIKNRKIPNITQIVKDCGDFNPRIELKLFLIFLLDCQKQVINSQESCEISVIFNQKVRQCYENVTTFNQNPISAMEILFNDLVMLNE